VKQRGVTLSRYDPYLANRTVTRDNAVTTFLPQIGPQIGVAVTVQCHGGQSVTHTPFRGCHAVTPPGIKGWR